MGVAPISPSAFGTPAGTASAAQDTAGSASGFAAAFQAILGAPTTGKETTTASQLGGAVADVAATDAITGAPSLLTPTSTAATDLSRLLAAETAPDATQTLLGPSADALPLAVVPPTDADGSLTSPVDAVDVVGAPQSLTDASLAGSVIETDESKVLASSPTTTLDQDVPEAATLTGQAIEEAIADTSSQIDIVAGSQAPDPTATTLVTSPIATDSNTGAPGVQTNPSGTGVDTAVRSIPTGVVAATPNSETHAPLDTAPLLNTAPLPTDGDLVALDDETTTSLAVDGDSSVGDALADASAAAALVQPATAPSARPVDPAGVGLRTPAGQNAGTDPQIAGAKPVQPREVVTGDPEAEQATDGDGLGPNGPVLASISAQIKSNERADTPSRDLVQANLPNPRSDAAFGQGGQASGRDDQGQSNGHNAQPIELAASAQIASTHSADGADFASVLSHLRGGSHPAPQGAAAQIAVRVSQAAANGEQTISLQLRPADLGRIDVRLTFDRDGNLQAFIQADSAQTLELLQKDARSLQQALDGAGLKMNAGGLSFGLRQQSGEAHAQRDRASQKNQIGLGGIAGRAGNSEEQAPIVVRVPNGRVDVRV